MAKPAPMTEREALSAVTACLVKTVHKMLPGFPEAQMQIDEAGHTVADVRKMLNQQETA